jgi:hypothetical protein
MTSKFKVGDRVEIHDSYTGYRGPATVTYVRPETIGYDPDDGEDECYVDLVASNDNISLMTEPVVEAPVARTDDYHSRKFDSGKSRMDLIPGECLEGIGDVLAYGAAKYAPDSWQLVPDAEARYRAALLRHLAEIQKHGLTSRDSESGRLHVDHVATNAAFLQFFARKS